MSEISLGNLYDINKNLMARENKISKPALKNKMNKIKDFIYKTNNRYYMLLCKDKGDYTVFYINSDQKEDNAIKELQLCLKNRGDILGIDKTQDNCAFEIWMRIKENIFCYYFFPYDEGVVEI